MSKYNLVDLFESNMVENMSADDRSRYDQLTSDDQLKLEKIFSMMKAEKNKRNDPQSAVVDRAGNTDSLAPGEMAEHNASEYKDEISEENDESKLPMDEEGKGYKEYEDGVEQEKLAKAGDLKEEEDPIEAEMKMHLKQYNAGNIDGDDLAKAFDEILNGRISPPGERGFNTRYGMEEGVISDKSNKDLIKMGTADMNLWHVQKLLDAGILQDSEKTKALLVLDPTNPWGMEESFDSLAKKLDKQKGIDKEEAGKIAGSIAAKKMAGAGKGPTTKQKKRMGEGAMQPGEGDLESGQTGNMNALTETGAVSVRDIVIALKNDAKATDAEIKLYMASVEQAGDQFEDADDYVEDFKNYIDDKALQEHFGRFMKDFQ